MTKSSFWQGKNVLVTGGAGFIGSHVVEKLVKRGAKVRVMDLFKHGSEKNLSSVIDDIELFNGNIQDIEIARKACNKQDIVMNLAAKVGGIEYNRTHQGTMLHHNIIMAATMTEAAHQENVERFLTVSSACVYPSDASVPTHESEGFRGEPEPTNGGYGWSKRVAELYARYYAEEFGMQIGIVRPYNCYGPRDHFDPKFSHVIPALIKRVFDGENPIKVWGSGKQTRSFLFVEDLAEGMILAIEKYPVPDPVNLGTDSEITIHQLIEKIISISGINATYEFDTSKPDGSMKRNSDNQLAREKIGFTAQVSFDEGLSKTIDWYRNEYIKEA